MATYNLNLPILQENELLTSYIERVATLNVLEKNAICELLKINYISDVTIFQNIDFIKEVLAINIQTEKLLKEHTFFKIEQFVMDAQEADEIANNVVVHRSPAYLKTLRLNLFSSCPICAKEDTKKHGYPIRYIHHCYPEVNVCHKHKCYLISTQPFKEIQINQITDTSTEDLKYSKWIYEFTLLKAKPLKDFNKFLTSLYINDWDKANTLQNEGTKNFAYYIHHYGNISNFSYSDRLRALYYQIDSIEEILEGYSEV